MNGMTSLSLESCERNLLNEHGQRTLGNVLCEKAGLWVPGQQFQSFVTVSEITSGLHLSDAVSFEHVFHRLASSIRPVVAIGQQPPLRAGI